MTGNFLGRFFVTKVSASFRVQVDVYTPLKLASQNDDNFKGYWMLNFRGAIPFPLFFVEEKHGENYSSQIGFWGDHR